MISKNNIDEVLFDYFEGNLSLQEKLEVDKFIGENPSFQKDFNAWENSFVEDDNLQYKHVDSLLADENKGKTPWFKWGISSLLLVLLSFLSYAIYHDFKFENRNNNTANNSNQDKNANSSSRNVVDNNTPTTITSTLSSEKSDIVTQSNTNTLVDIDNISKNSAGVERLRRWEEQRKIGHVNLMASFIGDNTTNNNNVAINDVKSNSIDATAVVETASILSFNEPSIKELNDFSQNIISVVPGVKKSAKKIKDEMHGGIELINLGDPFVLYGGASPIQENPSFAGTTDGIRIKTVSRSEWPELNSSSFLTNSISVDGYVNKIKGGVALVLSSDVMGANRYSSTGASFVYSPKFKLANISIEPSIKYGLNNRVLNWDKISAGDFIDPRTGVLLASTAYIPENIGTSNVLYGSFGAGLLINTRVFYAGFGLDNMFSPSYKLSFFDQNVNIPMKLTAQMGTDIRKNENSNWVYSPSISIRKQGDYNKIWMSNIVRYKHVLAGAHFSTADAMMFSLGYSNDKLRFTYSYGLSNVPTNFNLTNDLVSSHQLTMRYVIKK